MLMFHKDVSLSCSCPCSEKRVDRKENPLGNPSETAQPVRAPGTHCDGEGLRGSVPLEQSELKRDSPRDMLGPNLSSTRRTKTPNTET